MADNPEPSSSTEAAQADPRNHFANAEQFLAAFHLNPDAMFAHLQELEEQARAYIANGDRFTKLQAENQELQARIQRMNEAQPAPVSSVSPGPTFIPMASSHRSAKYPDPEPFDGSAAKYPAWLVNVRMKLTHNADHFLGEQNRMAYVYSRLSPHAQTYIHPHINASGPLNFTDVEEMIKTLSNTFDDPNRVSSAGTRLLNLRQTNKPFADFLAIFRKEAAYAGLTDEKALCTMLLNAVSRELKQYLVTNADADSLTFEQLVNRLQGYDIRHRALPSNQRFSTPFRSYDSNPSTPTRPTTSRSAPATPLTTSQGGDAMDLSANRNFRGPLTQAEKDERRNRNLCYYCGQSGHIAFRCPSKPSRSPLSFRKAEVPVLANAPAELSQPENS